MAKGTKKKNLKPKTQAQRFAEHAKLRAKERLGAEFTTKDIRAIVYKIQTGDAEFIDTYSLSRCRYQVEYKGMEFIVVYDKRCKVISTLYCKEDDAQVA